MRKSVCDGGPTAVRNGDALAPGELETFRTQIGER
jgi:hypothetical protein